MPDERTGERTGECTGERWERGAPKMTQSDHVPDSRSSFRRSCGSAYLLCALVGYVGLLLTLAASTAQGAPADAPLTAAPIEAEAGEIEALLDLTDDLNRGESSHSEITLTVQRARYQRSLRIEAWSQGRDRSLIRVLAPRRERGISTLKLGDEAWNYLPKIDRRLKISASAMGGAWMGSHLTNDDLIRGSRLRESYRAGLLERPQGEQGRYLIRLRAREEAPVVWGTLLLDIGPDRLPREIKYFSERGRLERTMRFSEPREFGARRVPTRIRVTPAAEPEEYSEISYQELRFDVSIPPRTFSLQALRP